MSDLPPGFDDLPEGFDDMPNVPAVAIDDHMAEVEADIARRQKKAQKQIRRRAKNKKYMPPDHLRDLMREQGDLKGSKNKELRNLFLGSMKFMPLALYKFLENIPMPWEATKDVNVTYNVRGILSMVDDTPTVAEPVYKAQWGATWSAMRMHKAAVQQSGGRVERAFATTKKTFLIFPDDVAPADYVADIMRRKVPEPVRNEHLDEVGDKAVIDWFYVPEPMLCPPHFIGESAALVVAEAEEGHFMSSNKKVDEWNRSRKGGRWFFSIEIMSTLYRLSKCILDEHAIDPNWYFLWDMKSFYTAKALHVAIPRAPRFEPLHIVDPDEREEDWTEFNDLGSRIVRERRDGRAKMTERQIQFPYLYSSEVRGAHIAPYHYPARVAVPTPDDESVPCFTFEPTLNNIVAVEKFFSERDVKAAVYAHRRDVTAANKAYVRGEADTAAITDAAAAPFTFSSHADIEGDEAPPGLCPLDSDDMADLDLDLHLPDDFEPFLADLPLEHETTRQAIAMMTAALDPFDCFKGGMRRRLDCNVVQGWEEAPVQTVPAEYPDKVRDSMTKLLKKKVANGLEREKLTMDEIRHGLNAAAERKQREAIPRTLDKLKNSEYFQQTRMDWLEVGLQLVKQGYTMLTQVLNLKGLSFLRVNYNFDTQAINVLTTKERKKSRLGPSFLLLCELLKLTKFIVDLHVRYRRGEIDAFQLADGIHYVFSHLTKVTNLHKHKKKMERQAKQARNLKHLIYHRFNSGEVQKGPGTGFWAPAWRTCMGFMRGMVPLLHRFLHNLVSRMFEGRKHRASAHRITKQRIEADTDLMIRDDFTRDLMAKMPEGVEGGARGRLLKLAQDHLSDAFRCWKRNAGWDPAEMDPALKELIRRYVGRKADAFKHRAEQNRQSIKNADAVDKTFFKKNLGQMTRLELMKEQDRQRAYQTDGPYISEEESLSIYGMVADWLSTQQFEKIPFPAQSHRAGIELLTLSLTRLLGQHNVANRLTQNQREEKKHIEHALDHAHDTLATIRDNLAGLRSFKPVKVDFMDHFSHLTPIYDVNAQERIIDAFLDSYLWYEGSERRLFPNWVKPADSEPLPVLVHQWCDGINKSPQIWETANGESVAMLQTTIGRQFFDKVDFKLFRKILELIMDKTLVDYIMARHNVTLQFRDMSHTHGFGLLRGFQFSAFLAQVWGLVIDLMVLGTQRARQLAGLRSPNHFLQFNIEQHAGCHPIRGYSRYNDQINVLLRFTKEQADDLRRAYVAEQTEAGEEVFRSIAGFKNKKCWPREGRMRLNLPDVNLARAVFSDFCGRLPPSIVDLSWDNSFVSVYSARNPNLLFDLGGFEVRIQPSCRIEGPVVESESMWRLRHPATREVTARAYLQVTRNDVKKIQNKIRLALMTVGNSTFQAIAAKWNSVLGEVVPYYREAIAATEGLQEIFVKGEKKMQQRVMMALNSKASVRFPAVIFYAPQEPAGGLGMLSVAQSLIPVNGAIAFKSGLTNHDGIEIPNALNYFTPWGNEIEEGKKAWEEFMRLKREKTANGMRVTTDEIPDLLDMGLPRIRTLFMADAQLYRFDKGFRARQEYTQFTFGRTRKDWWYHRSHDGSVHGSLKQYNADMLTALGGMGAILEHSLFKATGLTSWEGMLWNNSNSFELSKRDAKITKAQRGGLTNVPNRRFALWWSPTINRSNVFSNAALQLPTTGIFMHGKLVAIQKSLIGVFDKNRWSRTHQGIVEDMAKKIKSEEYSDDLLLKNVSVPSRPPSKAFDYDTTAADIVLDARDLFYVSAPSLLTAPGDQYTHSTAHFWIDVQLRWGDYDDHNIAAFARERYVTYTNGGKYKTPAGIVVAFDLAYCSFSAYGNWFDGLKDRMAPLIASVNKGNMQLTELRDLVKRNLQLQTSNPTEANITTTNIGEMFSDGLRTWIVDDSQTRFKGENGAVIILNPLTGDLRLSIVHRSVFKGQKRAKNLAQDKAAEVVNLWLRELPVGERPHRIIVTRSTFRQRLSARICDPNITIIPTDLNMVVSQIARHERVGGERTRATENVNRRFCVYDDWLVRRPPTVAYRMLQMILRGYFVDIDRTRAILEPDSAVKRSPNHFWPSYDTAGWQRVIAHIEDLILADACKRNKNLVLTAGKKEEILMGKKFTNDEQELEERAEIEKRRAERDAAADGTTKSARRRNDSDDDDEAAAIDAAAANAVSASGEDPAGKRRQAASAKRSQFEAKMAKDVSWRERAIAACEMPARSRQLYIDQNETNTGLPELTFPDDLLQKFLRSCDGRNASIAFIFGRKPLQNSLHSEASCLVVPPQIGKMETVAFPFAIPSADGLNAATGLHYLGILRTQAVDHCPNTFDVAAALRVADSLAIGHRRELEAHASAVEAAIAAAGGDEDEADVPPAPASLLATDAYDATHCPFFVTIAAVSDRDVIVNTNAISATGYTAAREREHALLAPSSSRRGGAGAASGGPQTLASMRPTAVDEAHLIPAITRVSPAISGVMLAPDYGVWNFEFMGQSWQDRGAEEALPEYGLVAVDTPLEYFASSHRPNHIDEFTKKSCADAEVDMVEAEDEFN